MNKFVNEKYDVITNGDIGFVFKETNVRILKNEIKITGNIHFYQIYKKIPLQDEYLIQILFPYDFPNTIPIVKEIENRIQDSPDYHNDNKNDGLCLGIPAEIHEKTHEHPSFKYFISEIIIPFLYANTFREKYDKYPWEPMEHHSKGVLDYYQNLFDLKDRNTTQQFLLNIAYFKNPIKGHYLCPCKSGKRFRNCHKDMYDTLIKYHSHKNIQKDIILILKDCNVPYINKLVKNMYTKKWYNIYQNSIRNLLKQLINYNQIKK